MAFKEPYTASDGYGGFSSCDTHMDPLLLRDGQFAKGINVTVRGGLLSTRPSFEDLGELGSGEFQGARAYTLDEADHLAFAISGKIYVRSPDGTIHAIGGTLSATGRIHFTQVYRWMVCQDGTSRPIVVAESSGVFSRLERDVVLDPGAPSPKICLVPGTVGAYAHGRYHYAPTFVPGVTPALVLSADQSTYLNLDVLPDASAETGRACVASSDVLDNLEPHAVFRMSEQRGLNEGGVYSLPSELGFVYGMGAMRGAATGTGVGSLFVFGSGGVASYDFGTPRAEWKNSNISQIAFTGPGTRSPCSIVNVNDDLWYVGISGHLRSINYDRAQLSGGSASSLANTVKSIEASRWVAQDTKAWIPKASVAHADNRLHFTAADGRALGSIELAQAYDANPTELPILHEGIWTGFRFLQVLSLEGVLHAVVESGSSSRLLRLGSGDADPGGVSVASELVTRMFPFVYNEASAYSESKRLFDVRLFMSNVTRPTSVVVEYRPENTPAWTSLGSYYVNVPAGSGPQFRRITMAPDTTRMNEGNPATGDAPWMFHAAQFRVRWTGRATISRFIARATIQEGYPVPMCVDDNPGNALLPFDSDDDFSYSVPLGGIS